MRVTVQEDTISKTLKKLETFVSIPQMQKQIGVVALAGVQRNFIAGGRDQAGSRGVWPPLADSTLRQRRLHGGGAKPLRDTGVLMNGIHPEFTGNNVEISTSDQSSKYAAHQHFGSKPAWAKRKRPLKIPARPFMMIPDSVIREMNAISAKFKV